MPVGFSRLTGLVISTALEKQWALPEKIWLIHVAMFDPEFVGYVVGSEYEREGRENSLRLEHQQL